MVKNLLRGHKKGEIKSLSINPKDISKLYANKKMYFKEALSVLGIKKIKVYQDSNLDRGNINLQFNYETIKICINEYLQKY